MLMDQIPINIKPFSIPPKVDTEEEIYKLPPRFKLNDHTYIYMVLQGNPFNNCPSNFLQFILENQKAYT